MERCDLVVLGGGPGGAISALLAAREGLSVVLVDPGTPRPFLEGMAPRLGDWLARQGLLRGFGGLIGPIPREVAWNGQTSTHNTEYLVERSSLDAHLQAAARKAGARLIAATGRPVPGGAELSCGARLEALHVIDARGRAAQGAARGRRPPFATVALCGWLEEAAPRSPGLRIAALPEGWVWLAVRGDGRIWAQFVGDARAGQSARDRLLAAAAAALPDALGLTLRQDQPFAREAAPILPQPMDDLGCLPVGDALAAMDPLAGHGQFWAVSSALAAAAVRRTRDARPGRATDDLCRRFLSRRAAEACLRNARIGRDFLRMETRFASSPFWAARRDFPDDRAAHEVTGVAVAPERPVIRNGLIETMEVLVTPQHPDGIAWFGASPAVAALRGRAGAAPLPEHPPALRPDLPR